MSIFNSKIDPLKDSSSDESNMRKIEGNFELIKDQYELKNRELERRVDEAEGLIEELTREMEYYQQQIFDLYLSVCNPGDLEFEPSYQSHIRDMIEAIKKSLVKPAEEDDGVQLRRMGIILGVEDPTWEQVEFEARRMRIKAKYQV